MQTLTITSIVIGSIGLMLCLLGILRLTRRLLMRSVRYEITGIVLLSVAAMLFLVSSNIHTYERLVYEQPIASLSFHQMSPQYFGVELKELGSGESWFYELRGDEWQLDAQILTWKGYANLLGLDAYYRLHRLSGRYTDIEQERTAPHTVHGLSEEQRIDLWSYAHEYRNWLNMVDATYGSAVFLPMDNLARYSVSISRNGLVARPDNAIAREAVTNWIGF
ncbi:MAG: cation/multidrug efflux pump [Gammaproteobacteria bacterium]